MHIIPDAQEPQQQVRGRPKYASYQNFKGRKSSSLMNLCGKEHHSDLENIRLIPWIYLLLFCVLCKVDKFICFFTQIFLTVLGHSVKHVHSSFAWWQVAEYLYTRWQIFKLNTQTLAFTATAQFLNLVSIKVLRINFNKILLYFLVENLFFKYLDYWNFRMFVTFYQISYLYNVV